jgi:hypothetical protein
VVAATLLAVLLITGCSRAVAVPDPTPTGADVGVCRQLLSALPEQVLDQDRRAAEPGTSSAAWGDPVITLRCGQGGRLFTTIGRQTYVEVAVPSGYAPEAGALVDVAAAVQAHDPLRRPCV